MTGYDQDLWAERLRYDEVEPSDAIEQFSVLRRRNLRLLQRTPEAALQRVGVHVERGEESLAHLVRLYAGHDLLHLRQVERVRATVA
ncbi:MAG: DinB family protein [Acidobacteria bacterium]|nr:DinB family protein [Acidobacteriota bacterium]